MRRMGFWSVVFIGLWLGLVLNLQAQSLPALQKSLAGLDAAVVIRELRTGAFIRLHEARMTQAFPPFSTLEIPVAMAALDKRVVRDLNEVMPWNRLTYPLPQTAYDELTHWTEDHTLRSAFIYSVPWYWQEMSERLGQGRLNSYLRKFNYGNQRFPADVTRYWQDDALAISAEAQADFLVALINESLPASKVQQRQLKMLILRESGEGYRYYLKNSTGFLQNGSYLGWSIGWLETSESSYVFSLNLTHRVPEVVKEAVITLPKQVLAAAEYWPTSTNLHH